MPKDIQRAVVIGAGTMGAAIAAHFANAGVPVTLLDIVPRELSPREAAKNLTLEDKIVRNRIVQQGIQEAIKSRPASFFTQDHAALVSTGNLEDNFETIQGADWVVEAIIENLEIKRKLMARIDKIRAPFTVVSTNTSGIPVSEIAAGCSEDFRQHFLGTHFFNPPRYLKLLEIIPTADTLPEVVARVQAFGENRLGKGVVLCKDTPNFIANRLGSVTGAMALDFVLKHGYTVSEVDAVTGPLIGRPKTATFRLLDLVGIDVANHVRHNLAEAVPDDEMANTYLKSEKAGVLQDTLVERGWLGNKTKVGFYKEVRQNGKKEFWPLNLSSLEHEPAEKARFDSVGKAKDLETLEERLKFMLAAEDRAGQLVQALTYGALAYASHRIPEIADTPTPIDDAMRWGFVNQAGPFEIWDMLGVAETLEQMEEAGYSAAPWVREMVAAGYGSFYQVAEGRVVGVYNPGNVSYEPVSRPPSVIILRDLKAEGREIARNPSASLIDLGDGVACVEFHTKMNALDEDIGLMMQEALTRTMSDFDGLVIGNDGDNFSAGANVLLIVLNAQAGQWDQLEAIVKGLQDLHMAIRYSPKPVVIAPAGLTLGGGAEMMMHGSRVVAAAELYTGLVEVGMGLIPAGGGTKEMIRRVVNPPMRTSNATDLAYLQRLFEQVGQAKVATSAEEARQLGMLSPEDRVVMNRTQLLAAAKREVLHLVAGAYHPPLPEKIYAAGREGLAALRLGIYTFKEGNYITDYEAIIGEKLAKVMTGGEISQPAWLPEQYFLDLEREAFLSLCGEENTQQRIWHFLQTGKPLRN
jgi:3-hydroxyacyl-CoA dehydrogenase